MATATEVGEKALDKIRPPKGQKTPKEVDAKLKRGREGLREVSARRRLGIEFARNNHYATIDKTGVKLSQAPTLSLSEGGDKPNHRVRISRDILSPVLKGKISAATQRIPGYEVLPTTHDPEDYSAARISKNVAVGGYDIWGLKEVFRRGVWNALVTEEAFFMPYWDSEVGPFIEVDVTEEVEVDALDEDNNPTGQKEVIQQPTGETEVVGMGEVKVGVYSGLEVMWEPGVEFENSPWYAIETARPIEVVEQEAGYLGGKLEADAEAHSVTGQKKSKGSHLALVTEYFERPCANWPKGRRLWLGNGRELFPEEDYPLRDKDDEVVDAPCLHRLYYSIDGESERARGLVQALVEVIRQYDFAGNKAAEFLNLCLVPQLIAEEGVVKGVITDEPGGLVELEEGVDPSQVKWREMPSMPREFENERQQALQMMGFISNDNPVPARVESAKAIESLAQKDVLAWEDFIEDLADVHGGVMRDALTLVQLYYTEERMIRFRGRTGWEAVEDFRGADIRGQTDVRVRQGSLEPLTRAMIEQKIMNLSTMAQGFIPPEVLFRSFAAGNIDILNESYEEDEAQANFIISQIRAGTFWDLPKRRVFPGEESPLLDPQSGAIAEWEQEPQWEVDPERDVEGKPIPGTGKLVPGTGQPVMQTQVEGWMPRPFDGVPIIKRRIETWMKSDEWRNLEEGAQEATGVYYDALLRLEAKNAERQTQMQNQAAEQFGLENAAAPQPPKGAPSLPALDQAPPQ